MKEPMMDDETRQAFFQVYDAYGPHEVEVFLERLERGQVDGMEYACDGSMCGCLFGTLEAAKGGEIDKNVNADGKVAWSLPASKYPSYLFTKESIEVSRRASKAAGLFKHESTVLAERFVIGYIKPANKPDNDVYARWLAEITQEWLSMHDAKSIGPKLDVSIGAKASSIEDIKKLVRDSAEVSEALARK